MIIGLLWFCVCGVLLITHAPAAADEGCPVAKVAEEKPNYFNAHITNDLDYQLRSELDQCDRLLENSPKKAHNQFKRIYRDHKSPRALHGMARALNKLAMTSEASPQEAKMLQGK